MIKKVKAFVRLSLPAGNLAPTTPRIGPSLGQHGVNTAAFCKDYNSKTQNKVGLIIPAKITIYEDRSYTFILKSPPASFLLLKFANLKKGRSKKSLEAVGSITFDQLKEIALMKKEDLSTSNIIKAMTIIKGTALNMGISVI